MQTGKLLRILRLSFIVFYKLPLFPQDKVFQEPFESECVLIALGTLIKIQNKELSDLASRKSMFHAQ